MIRKSVCPSAQIFLSPKYFNRSNIARYFWVHLWDVLQIRSYRKCSAKYFFGMHLKMKRYQKPSWFFRYIHGSSQPVSTQWMILNRFTHIWSARVHLQIYLYSRYICGYKRNLPANVPKMANDTQHAPRPPLLLCHLIICSIKSSGTFPGIVPGTFPGIIPHFLGATGFLVSFAVCTW